MGRLTFGLVARHRLRLSRRMQAGKRPAGRVHGAVFDRAMELGISLSDCETLEEMRKRVAEGEKRILSDEYQAILRMRRKVCFGRGRCLRLPCVRLCVGVSCVVCAFVCRFSLAKLRRDAIVASTTPTDA